MAVSETQTLLPRPAAPDTCSPTHQGKEIMLRDLYLTVAQGEHQCLKLGMYPELGDDDRHMVALRPDAHIEPSGDLPDVQAFGKRLQDLLFPRGELRKGLTSLIFLFSLPAGEAMQLHDLFQGHERLTRSETPDGVHHLNQMDRLVQNPRGPLSTARATSARSKLALRTSACACGFEARSSPITSPPYPSEI